MKIECRDCSKYLGDMVKGKIHKDAVVLCKDCVERYETYKSLAEYKGPEPRSGLDLPDFLKDLLHKHC